MGFKHPCYLLLLCAMMGAEGAEPGHELYLDYLTPVLQQNAVAAGDVWDGTGAGGYLLRFRQDVDGDGRPELWLTASARSFGLWADWTVFAEDAAGNYSPYRPAIHSPFYLLVDETPAAGLVFVSWGRDQSRYSISRARFENGQIHTEHNEVAYPAISSLEAGQGVKRINPKLEIIHLDDFLRDPQRPWTPVDATDLGINLMGYLFMPADVERIKGLTLTPKAALTRLEELRRTVKAAQADAPDAAIVALPTGPPQQLLGVPPLAASTSSQAISASYYSAAAIVILLLGLLIYLGRRKA